MAVKATKKADERVIVSKTDDGGVLITFTLPWTELAPIVKKSAEKLGNTITVPGFRQGKAPLDILEKHIPRESLVQDVVGAVLPPLITEAYKKHEIRPIMYPKVDLLHAHDGEDWEIRVTTAQFPEFKLGDYKKMVNDAISKDSIWTPEKGAKEQTENKVQSQEDKEAIALKTLVENVEIKLPSLLVEEESNQRIANLLSRIEKLGLSLESYLASQKKDVETLRSEYAKQASEALKLELILGKVAEEEKIAVTEMEIEAFGQALLADPKRAKEGLNEDDKANIRSLLTKRKAIESLVS